MSKASCCWAVRVWAEAGLARHAQATNAAMARMDVIGLVIEVSSQALPQATGRHQWRCCGCVTLAQFSVCDGKPARHPRRMSRALCVGAGRGCQQAFDHQELAQCNDGFDRLLLRGRAVEKHLELTPGRAPPHRQRLVDKCSRLLQARQASLARTVLDANRRSDWEVADHGASSRRGLLLIVPT